ncbi:uncharacterized protein LOC119681964 isoform X1 [Teleopsis dalmanni]|uniref:uncharacterized protein LOC119681964 isoform X1 n=1 Tax=Teleopsis dalmanni TaxID=139649 RepID=UPI0018CF2A46|nr:uncharacterized protein LOC119681964 isoform X1 [Teleopsis dalmanni]
MKRFTVKIDLSSFFNDQRKLVIVMVDPTWTSIAALQHRVEHLFEIKPVLFLTADDCFIPPEEPVKMLKFFSIIKAFIPEDSLRKKFRKSKAKAAEDECAETLSMLNDDLKQRKRKFQVLENGCKSSTPNQPKRTKSILDVQPKEKSCEISSTNEVVTCTEPQINQLSKCNINISTEIVADIEPVTNEIVSNVLSNKKKRERTNKKNKVNISNSSPEEQANLDTSCDINILTSTRTLNEKDLRLSTNTNSQIKSQHIFFDSKADNPDLSKNVSVDRGKPAKQREFISFRCGVTNNERRQFNNSISNQSKRNSVSIIEHVIITPKETLNKFKEVNKTDSHQANCADDNSCNEDNDVNKTGTDISRKKSFSEVNDESIILNEIEELQCMTTFNKSEICEKLKVKSPSKKILLVEKERNSEDNISGLDISKNNTELNTSNVLFKNLSAKTNNIGPLNKHYRRTDSPVCKSSIIFKNQITTPLNISKENLAIAEQNEKNDTLEVSKVSVSNHGDIFQMDVTAMNSTKICDGDDKKKNVTQLYNSDINKIMDLNNDTEWLDSRLNNSSVMSIENECDESDRHDDLNLTNEESKLNEQLANSNVDITIEAELPRISIQNCTNSIIVSEINANASELLAANKTDIHMDYTFDENSDEVIDLDETENESFLMDITTSVTVGETDLKKQLEKSKPLNDLPNVGDIVIFKMLRLDELCTPTITDYIKGICEYVNKRTKSIKWRILDGHSQIHRIPSKFATEFDDSTDTDIINIKLNDMIEPKLLQK